MFRFFSARMKFKATRKGREFLRSLYGAGAMPPQFDFDTESSLLENMVQTDPDVQFMKKALRLAGARAPV